MTTEELLSRMEREHVQQGHLCVGCWDAGTDDYWLPCDVARVVAHARSLEAALESFAPAIAYAMAKTWKPEDFAEYRRLAALGEAQ